MLTQLNRSIISRTGNIGTHQLFQDSYPMKVMRRETVMSEDINGRKVPVLRFGGQFQRAGKPNANGRIYSSSVLEQAIEEIQEDVNSRRILGEYDHPPDAKIHLDRVSHLITKIWLEPDGTVMGEAEVLEKTQHGAQLKALLESNINIGISSRGVGDMETILYEGEEYYSVLPGFTFVTFDIVAEPSVHGSYMSILESKNRFLNRNHDSRADRETQVRGAVRDFLKGLR